jgi:hypothetical protein
MWQVRGRLLEAGQKVESWYMSSTNVLGKRLVSCLMQARSFLMVEGCCYIVVYTSDLAK